MLCIDSYDMTGNGGKNLILGRQDGNIEIYYINLRDEMDATSLIFVEVQLPQTRSNTNNSVILVYYRTAMKV